ncbi:P-loop containing nucleoside triphosphate hydrolase protein [Lophiotrema nucula]|uniref:P-loop containing nucleoside triphosphate hydrolase protein n=1 Tax=Lophiotrema nucula TaxID=690887 RepID=A0A6A5YJN6_9PLEO|nr:P-loop containing nucleoside triphosphate hydrolase protein [Lophiotrema nucula]
MGDLFQLQISTSEATDDVPYTQRTDAARQLSQRSPKLAYFAGLLAHICLEQGRKLVVFVEFPMVLWNVLAFVEAIGIPYLVISSKHSQQECERAIERFNDPEDNNKILLSNFKCSGASANLHKVCADMIILEVPHANSVLLQAIGRLHRIKQKEEVGVWLVTTDETFDQVVQWRACQKYLPQLKALIDVSAGITMASGPERPDALPTDRLALERFLGQRTSRHHDYWGD